MTNLALQPGVFEKQHFNASLDQNGKRRETAPSCGLREFVQTHMVLPGWAQRPISEEHGGGGIAVTGQSQLIPFEGD